ncbi:MAG: DegT/DnrJ/EryC1/StrS family aminotransferase, partial [Bdellovibrionaceae bacterium]|nr:DegT/DnrJ/EryC1/StrS family aminotransferase [Pseudobdellovibrionaceae bacterium]
VWTQKRQQIAKIFDEFFSSKGIKTMRVLPPAECVYHLYVIEVTNRNAIAEKLKSLGVATGIHYPIPLHLQPALSHLGGREGEFPAAERAATRLLSIPIYPELSEAQIELIKKAF